MGSDQKRAEIEKLNTRLQRLLDSFLDGVLEREEYTAEKAKLMSRKKSLQEERDDLTQGQAMWIEPLKEWILTAKNAGEIAMRGSSQEKRALAQQVFGSNLVLDSKKARGCSVKPWSSLVEKSPSGGMVGAEGFARPALAAQFAGKSGESAASCQAHTHGDTQNPGEASPELTRLVRVWAKLPKHIQKTILTLTEAYEPPAIVPLERPERVA